MDVDPHPRSEKLESMERVPIGRDRLPAWPELPLLIVLALTIVGGLVRILVAGQSLFGDELSTYWIVSTHDFGGVISTVYSDVEITPPLYFVAAWLSTRIDLTPELLRAPALVAGVGAIPLTYLLGARTFGRNTGLLAATFTAFSPFMILYSAEARSYGLAITFVLLSTVCLLYGRERQGLGWWAGYAVCSALAVYSHYTAVFALVAQFLWILVTSPRARVRAILANLGAIALFIPWLWGLKADLNSPTTSILSTISPFNLSSTSTAVSHWVIGYPISGADTRLRDLPGSVSLALLALGIGITVVALAFRWLGAWDSSRWRPWLFSARSLPPTLAVSTLAGLIVASAVGTNVLDAAHLAVSWPALATCLAALLLAPGPRLRPAAVTLTVAAFAIAGVKMLRSSYQSPDYESIAATIDRQAARGDVVIDASGLTPGPLSGLDVALKRHLPVFRVGMPSERSRPFGLLDSITPTPEVMHRAVSMAAGGRIFVAAPRGPIQLEGIPVIPSQLASVRAALPRDYRLIRSRTYSGFYGVGIDVYAREGSRDSR